MTQYEQDLLLKDLCERLPYGVKFKIDEMYLTGYMTKGGYDKTQELYGITREGNVELLNMDYHMPVESIKPYLFPISSMTEEQKKELKVMCDWCDDEKDAQSILVLYHNHCVMKTDVIDWFIKNHFDYRGLIPLGLANDATGLNIY